MFTRRGLAYTLLLIGLGGFFLGGFLGANKITPHISEAPWMLYIALGLLVIAFGGVMLLLFSGKDHRPSR